MPILLQSVPGRVVRIDDPAALGRAQVLGVDPPITYDAQYSIITRMTLSQQVNAQFLHTIGSHIYIYVFGDRIGQVTLSGLSFASICNGDDRPGAQLAYQWYKDNRASKRAAPVRVSIGEENVDGFVISFQEDVVDAATQLVQWNTTMVVLPEAT